MNGSQPTIMLCTNLQDLDGLNGMEGNGMRVTRSNTYKYRLYQRFNMWEHLYDTAKGNMFMAKLEESKKAVTLICMVCRKNLYF